MLQHPSVVVQAEQQRADCVLAALVPTEARHDTVSRARMLHLDHRALARVVRAGLQLRNHTVQTRAFEAREPVERKGSIACYGCEMQRRFHFAEQLLEGGTARPLWRRHEIASRDRE